MSDTREAGGGLLVGQGTPGGAWHAVTGGAAACTPYVPIARPVPIAEAKVRRWCQRIACRRPRQGAMPRPAAAGDVEHVCPTCYVERAAAARPCPSCGSPYAAVPETAIV